MPVGKLNEFNSSTEDFESWVGVLDNYLIANDIDKTDTKTTGAAKAIAIFLSSVGVSNYRLMQDLVSPKKPEDVRRVGQSLERPFQACPESHIRTL
jgi:hypothetical protein